MGLGGMVRGRGRGVGIVGGVVVRTQERGVD